MLEHMKRVHTATWDDWGVNIQSAQLSLPDGTDLPLLEFGANAVFDPSVDYLYVTQYEFDKFFLPSL
jgi:hypothetical protein